MLRTFYRKTGSRQELCYYVEASEALTPNDVQVLTWLLAETFEPELFGHDSFFKDELVQEVGPRLSFATPFSTNAVAICHAVGLTTITRLECSRRTVGSEPLAFDRMTEMVYPTPLTSFAAAHAPEAVYTVPVLEEGPEALRKENKRLGLGMDEADIAFYHRLFTGMGRNPTNVECFQLGQANSEHSRHWVFRGRIVIDGVKQPETLFELVKSTLKAHPAGSLIAFSDNSSAIRGWHNQTLAQSLPGRPSPLVRHEGWYHPLFTAETHNFPTGIAPFPGAETGTGGRIRDVQATGRGALVVAGTVGYCVGRIDIPGCDIWGDDPLLPEATNLASPVDIIIQASNGASDYGNKFGEPVIAGFCRSFDQRIGSERRAWLKPILFTGGVGHIRDEHITKGQPVMGMVLVQIGGPAYRIGMGGGAASSMIQGQNDSKLDYNAVQRGDAEMERKMDRVVRACVELGLHNPIVSIHDQGAGGPCNVLTELANPVGGRVEIRNIRCGDQTLSVLEIWGAEYQERNALLIWPHRLLEFMAICERERVAREVLGAITGDGRIVVHDWRDHSTPVDLSLAEILGELPQKTYSDSRLRPKLEPLKILKETVSDHLEAIFTLPSVGSKGFLVRKVDRSVTGLVARQQCCGPLQLPVSDVAVTAANTIDNAPPGTATAIGEQPIKMLVNVAAGARMAIGEAVTNLAAACLTHGLDHVKCSGNEMWAAKRPGEIANLYDAVMAARDLMVKLGIAIDGGKDSLSMAATVDGEVVKAPGQLVVSLYAATDDVRLVATPDIKQPGKSELIFIDLGGGKNRLGGSALAQAYGQIGDESPDIDDPDLLKRAFAVVQQLIRSGVVLSYHDRSDGGLITTLTEMAMAGNAGLTVDVPASVDPVAYLFAEELGMVLEAGDSNTSMVKELLAKNRVPFTVLGRTAEERQVVIRQGDDELLDKSTGWLHIMWEETSDQLEYLQMDHQLASNQAALYQKTPSYRLTFTPAPTNVSLTHPNRPKVAIIREEGSNGDREMAAAFYVAGFEPWDIAMTDLLQGDTTMLDQFRGIAFVGGFSYADALGSAKGWAGTIRFNPKLQQMFRQFFERTDTFSLGVCNGCQLMALLGIVPYLGHEGFRFIHNTSGRFESRFPTVRIEDSPAIMLRGMAGSVLGVPVAHGEGRLHCSPELLARIRAERLAPIVFVDDAGNQTEQYPHNPNGSPGGITALCSPDGRHLALMPHPERVFQLWQWPWLPEQWKEELAASPWLRLFQNARAWCDQVK